MKDAAKTGWGVRPLGDVLHVLNGYAFKSKQFSGTEGTPLIRIRDLKAGTGTVVNFVGEYDPQFVVGNGDLLIGMDGEFRCHEWQGGRALLNQRVCKLTGFAYELLPRFLYYGINKYLKEIEDQTAYTTVKHLSSKSIKAIDFPLPPFEEQQRIVAVLDEAFEGLARARAHAEANLQNARELFEASLRSVFHNTETGWPMITLPEVCVDFGRGKSKHRPRNEASLYGGNIPFIQTGYLSDADHFVTEFSQTYTERGLAQSKLWPAGTVCIAIVGATIGESGILDFDACFPDSVIGMTADRNRADAEYIEFLLQSFKAELKEAGKGSARDNINLATFKDRHFPIPDVATQKTIAEKLMELSREANSLSVRYQEKLNDLDDLRQSLLQKAFAGELT